MNIGHHIHLVTLETLTGATSDQAGGYTETWAPMVPATWHCAMEDATTAAMERNGFGTTMAQATHILTGRYHKGLSPKGRVLHGSRVFSILSARNRNERSVQSVLLVGEVLP